MKRSRIVAVVAIALLAGCGKVGPLKPAAGRSLPVKPMMARSTPTPEQLLTTPTYARPKRVDELVTKSEPRRPDPFDLPPPSGGAAPALPAGTDSAGRLQRYRAGHPAMTHRVRKAVFPVAGLGTRLLPATKAMPKELLTIVDRPLIQYAVDEAREAGIEQLIFVTGRGKAPLVDYFDTAFELESTMTAAGKSLDALEPSRARYGEIVSVRQQQPLGLGHAVWCARHIVDDEPFAVLLPDDLMAGKPGALRQMVDAWEKVGGNLIATEKVPADKTGSYGIITPGAAEGALTQVLGLVEKPSPEEAPSRLGVIGRYILQPEVMHVLDAGEKGAGGEIQLTDALARLIGQQPFHALKVDAVRHDCGDKAGFVIANLALALEREDLAPRVRAFIASL